MTITINIYSVKKAHVTHKRRRAARNSVIIIFYAHLSLERDEEIGDIMKVKIEKLYNLEHSVRGKKGINETNGSVSFIRSKKHPIARIKIRCAFKTDECSVCKDT